MILENHPENGEVLFDKAASLAMLNNIDDSLDILAKAVGASQQFRIKAKGHKAFVKLYDNTRFLQLVSG